MEKKTELGSQKLENHDRLRAIDIALTEADEAKVLAERAICAQEQRFAIAELNEGLIRLNKVAENALAKYDLLLLKCFSQSDCSPQGRFAGTKKPGITPGASPNQGII